MSIQQFELFHGAVLAKLMRNDRPITLTMIETNEDAWSVYTINDEMDLFIKIRTIANELLREKDSLSWQFLFTPKQIQKIKCLRSKNKVALALVCGQQNIKEDMQIAFIDPYKVEKIIDFSLDKSQSLTVKSVPGKKLQVISDYKVEVKVSRNALDKWEVPGRQM